LPVPGRTLPGAKLGAIPGVVPSLVGGFEGCAFRDRCPHAMAECARLAPPLAAVGEGRGYRCHLPPVVAAANASKEAV
jgi:peptide/nickel transport system ATP-binding protein